MREMLMQCLHAALSNNVGQRLTAELATGIINTVNGAALQLEANLAKAEKKPVKTTIKTKQTSETK